MIKERQTGKNYYVRAFMLGLGLSFLVFAPFMAIDGGRFLFYGDFNVQQVPFYRLAHDAVRAGQFGWNQHTDLGVSFIGSYSFYLLGSPFFWLTLPFPSQWMQYMMGPLFILKFACASLTGYVYLHRYTRTPDTALIGSVLYAFSGFSVYNIFFNHFHEAIVFFPLLLAALDEYMATRRRGVFALAVAGCCIVNYYFFVGQVTFTLIYFFLRMLFGSWRLSLRDFLFLALEAVLGVGVACGLLIPSVLAVLQNSRTGNVINGWNAVLYNKNQRYLHILECFFFPPDLPARPNFTPESESRWASLGAWLPLFSMSGVIGWLQLRRKHWLKKLLWILFAMALIPGLNSAFQMMNSAYYARWFYMLTLVMALATVMALEEERVDWKRSITWTLSITLGITAIVGFTPVSETVDGEKSLSFGLMQYPTRFWSYVAVALLSLGVLIYLFTFRRTSRKDFQRGAMWAMSAISVLYSIFFVALGKTQADYTWDHLIPYSLNGGTAIDLPDLQECRSDFFESTDNAGMFWKVPTIQAFHSIVPGSIMEFYSSVGVQRDVASRPEVSHYGVRGITSVHWLFDDDHDGDYFAGEDFAEPSMPGWEYYGNANGFDIWENLYYIPMGFSYDYYITRSEYEQLSKGTDSAVGDRELAMLRAVVLEDEDANLYSELLAHLPEEDRIFSEEGYMEDCRNRAASACRDFHYTATGFSATLDTRTEELVFFSVPWESGWSAAVNGEPAEIVRVNVGFMAVVVPLGEQVQIEFTYHTPGLLTGMIVTVLSIGLLVAYLFLVRRLRQKQPAPLPHLMRPGRFSEYEKKHKATFLRPGAMTLRFPRQAALPPDEPEPLPPPVPEQSEEPPPVEYADSVIPDPPEEPADPEEEKTPEEETPGEEPAEKPEQQEDTTS